MKQLIQQVQQNVIRAKNFYQDFRLYDLASYSMNYLTPKDTFEKDGHLAYGLKARQRLDLYRTKNPKKQRPLIVFVHGGSWQHGNKRDYLFLGETFAREGYDVAVINYHLAPEHIFPAFIDDIAQAIHYLTQNQSKLNISTDNIILMGHSAGAFNVMSVVIVGGATAEKDFEQEKLDHLLKRLLQDLSVKAASQLAADLTGIKKKIAYQRALELTQAE